MTRSSRARRVRSRRRQAGFTLVEVMVSLGIMTIGAMALIGMQQQVTRANVHARELTTAMQIAQTWVERLKVDGMRWNQVSGVPGTDLVNTDFLDNVAVQGMEGVFTTIPLTQTLRDAGLSSAFDYYGRDVPASINSMAGVHYCASYRLTWVFFNRNASPPADNRALRADVRVWWAKERAAGGAKAGGNAIGTDFVNCVDGAGLLTPPVGATPAGDEFDNYHVVYLSTVIRPAA